MADETVEIDVNVNTEGAEGKFVRLQTQIKETRIALQRAQEAGDSVKFNQLKDQLDDLEDKLEVTSLKSKKFDDALAGLPGPAGQAGGAIKNLDGAFKLFIANPIVAVIAGVTGALILMKKSLESTAEGTATLNRVSQAFSAILGPILATVEKVAVPVFNGFAFILEKVAAGFSRFARFLGISQDKIKEATLSVDKVQQDANKAEAERQKQAQEARDKAEAIRLQRQKEAAEKRKQQEEKERQERLEKQALYGQAELDLRRRLRQEEFQRENDSLVLQQSVREGNATRQVELADRLQKNLANVQAFALKTTEENTKAQIKISEEEFETRQKLLYGISAAVSAVSDLVGRNTVAGKALAISATLINTYASIAGQLRAFSGVPIPGYAIAQAIATGLVGLKAVRDIIKTPVPGPGGGGGGGGAAATSGGVGTAQTATPSFSAPGGIGGPQIAASAGQQGTIAGIVAGSIAANQSESRPMRAYVVQSDLRTESQLDRRIRTAARLGG